MKISLQRLTNPASLLSFLLLHGIRSATAHYGYPFVIVNDVVSERWEYVRPTVWFTPNWEYSGQDAMCGFNATKPLFPVKTLKIEAGSSIGFGASGQTGSGPDESKVTTPWNPDWTMYHDGPATAYLSKAPDGINDLNDYEGEGDWFKIGVVGASDGMHWDYGRVNQLRFTIPKTTPPGKYLMRAEHLNIRPWYKVTEMYIGCAHLEITGSGGGNPGPMTKFPGAFDAKDPGIWLPNALYDATEPMDELKNWQGAGPKVWTG